MHVNSAEYGAEFSFSLLFFKLLGFGLKVELQILPVAIEQELI
jgi:hypothetical protein